MEVSSHQDQHLAEVQKIGADLEDSIVKFYLSVQKSIKLFNDSALQQLFEIEQRATHDNDQLYRRNASISLLQMQKVVGDIERSSPRRSTEMIAERDDYRLSLENMGTALIDSIGQLLAEARLERLTSVNEASAAFTQEAFETD